MKQSVLRKWIKYYPDTGEIFWNKDSLYVKKGNKIKRHYSDNSVYIKIFGGMYNVLHLLTLYMEGYMPYKCRLIDGDRENLKYENILPDPKDRMLTYDYVRKAYSYDPEEGVLRRKVHLNKFPAGSMVGGESRSGHLRTQIFGKPYLVHRLIWFYMEGYFPEHCIDHIDRNPKNNKWKNLREVTHQCNMKNRAPTPLSKTGVPGVVFIKKTGEYLAILKSKGHKSFSGKFNNFTDAVCFRLVIEQCLGWNKCQSDSPAFNYVKENVNPFAIY